MSESAPIHRVAVRGDDAVAETLAATDLEVVGLDAADAVVAVGEEAFTGAALTGSSRPLLPVDLAERYRGVSRNEVSTAAEAIRTGAFRTVSHPVLDVTHGGELVGRAVFDVTLMTSEPARISEYGLTIEGERVWTGRADGIVVASPFGSAGYSRAAGGPIVVGGDSMSVVPIAPFAIRTDTWVANDSLQLSVERDEGDVSLFADEEELQRVDRDHPIRVAAVSGYTALHPTDD